MYHAVYTQAHVGSEWRRMLLTTYQDRIEACSKAVRQEIEQPCSRYADVTTRHSASPDNLPEFVAAFR